MAASSPSSTASSDPCPRCFSDKVPKCDFSQKKKLKNKKSDLCFCCGLCKQCGSFKSKEDADLSVLVTELGLNLLQFQEADPTSSPELVKEQVDDVVEKIFHDWRTDGYLIEMLPPVKEKMEKSDEEEKQVHELFRKKCTGHKNVGLFPSYKAGPLISKSKSGDNLDSMLQDPKKRAFFFKAFNLDDSPKNAEGKGKGKGKGEGWKWQINRVNRQEKDLVLVLGDLSLIAHVEVKGGKSQGNAEDQFKTFREYLERTHGTYLQDLSYVPILAKHTSTTAPQLCEKYMLNIKSSEEDFETWWTTFQQLEVFSETSNEKFEIVIKRLILMSSLVLTSLPMELTKSTPDSHLIILRPQQWNLLWNTHPKRAILNGIGGTGKSMSLELGLAFVRTGITSRFLVSLAEYGSAQNVLRNHFFEHSEIAFLCSNVDNEVPADILKRLLESISDNEEAFICIDNLDFQSVDCMSQIKKLLDKKTDVWIVADGDMSYCEEESGNLGFQYFNFS